MQTTETQREYIVTSQVGTHLQTRQTGSSLSTKNRAMTGHTPEEKVLLVKSLKLIWSGQKAYGKSVGQLEDLIELFSFATAKYPMEAVIAGLAEYVTRKPDLPAPADIIAIIDPPKPEKPKLDRATYIACQKKGWENMTFEEEHFVRAYERQQLDMVTASDIHDPVKTEAKQHEVDSLRREIIDLKRENASLRQAWQEQRAMLAAQTGKTEAQRREEFAASCKQTPFDKVAATIQFMQQQGASAEDIAAFRASQGVSHA